MLCPKSLSPSPLESRGKGVLIFVTLPELILQNALEFSPEVFIRNVLVHSSLKSEISVFDDCLFFYFLLLFLLTFFLYSIN